MSRGRPFPSPDPHPPHHRYPKDLLFHREFFSSLRKAKLGGEMRLFGWIVLHWVSVETAGDEENVSRIGSGSGRVDR